MVPLTLAEIHGPGHFLSPKAFSEAAAWLPANSYRLENLTGAFLPLAGGMPILCHAGAATEAIQAFIRDCDVPVAEEILIYRDEEDYIRQARDLLAAGLKAVTVYPTPTRVVPQGSTWIPTELQSFLNNKINLDKLAPPNGVPERRIVKGADLKAVLETAVVLPVAVKVATDLGSGGGADVALCLSARHVRRAVERFADVDHVVVEGFIRARRNDCLHYAIDHSGKVSYLGAARQICDRRGSHLGNWVGYPDAGEAAATELGLSIAREAASRGYVGLAGLDVMTRDDGRAFAIDLNFRPASSSAQILLRDHVMTARGRSLSRLCFCTFAGPMREAIRRLRPFVARQRVLPLGAFDPAGFFNEAASFLRLLVIGDGREEIESTIVGLSSSGFAVGGWKRRPLPLRVIDRLRSIGSRTTC